MVVSLSRGFPSWRCFSIASGSRLNVCGCCFKTGRLELEASCGVGVFPLDIPVGFSLPKEQALASRVFAGF